MKHLKEYAIIIGSAVAAFFVGYGIGSFVDRTYNKRVQEDHLLDSIIKVNNQLDTINKYILDNKNKIDKIKTETNEKIDETNNLDDSTTIDLFNKLVSR